MFIRTPIGHVGVHRTSRMVYSASFHGERNPSGKFDLSQTRALSPIPARVDSQDLELSRAPGRILPIAVVVKFVVTSKCNQDTKSSAQGKKYLSCSVNPYLKWADKGHHPLFPQNLVTSLLQKGWEVPGMP